MKDELPLVITLQLDPNAVAFFNNLRQRYFPPSRNFLAAHLTLFHQLPAGEVSLNEDLHRWSLEQTPFALQFTELRNLGRGVAYKAECPALLAIHRKMQQRWQAWLTPRDKEKLWPHLTIQNKVTAEEARQTLTQLQATFRPFTACGTGFSVWTYEGGPWRWASDDLFGEKCDRHSSAFYRFSLPLVLHLT